MEKFILVLEIECMKLVHDETLLIHLTLKFKFYLSQCIKRHI